MADDLKSKIATEIKRVNREIVAQKKLIKNSMDDKLRGEAAELEMKALTTRLAVLEANLAKQDA